MTTTRELKRRIGSVTNTHKITSAMRMVAAAKLNRAQQAAKQARPYASELSQTLQWMATSSQHPFFSENESELTSLLVLTSDKGLAGAFNSQVNKAAHAFLEKQQAIDLFMFGRKGQDFFRSRYQTMIQESVIQATAGERAKKMDDIITQVAASFLAGKTGSVWLAYNQFYNPLKQTPVLKQLLPIIAMPEADAMPEANAMLSADAEQVAEKIEQDTRQVLLEPSSQELLAEILSDYLSNQAYTALLETEAGEHGSRMVAMESASKNASEMIDALTLQYNRLRQAAITSELIEIINGAQAL